MCDLEDWDLVKNVTGRFTERGFPHCFVYFSPNFFIHTDGRHEDIAAFGKVGSKNICCK